MELRSRKQNSDENRNFCVSDYFDDGGGIFIQFKLDDGKDCDWEDETHLLFAKNGPKSYTIQVPDGVHAELQLLCNANFTLQPVQQTGTGNERIFVDIAGPPIGKATVRTYYDLFYLTAKIGALGPLPGPGTWTLNPVFDRQSDTFCLTVTGRSGEKCLGDSCLKFPLYVLQDSWKSSWRIWGMISVVWSEMEKVFPGICDEQKLYLTGVTGINGKPRASRAKKKAPSQTQTVPEVVEDSEDEPLVRSSTNEVKKPSLCRDSTESTDDSDSDDHPLISRRGQSTTRRRLSKPGFDSMKVSSTKKKDLSAAPSCSKVEDQVVVKLPSPPSDTDATEADDRFDADLSCPSLDYHNGTWRSVLRRPIRLRPEMFIDPTPLVPHPPDWRVRSRRAVLRRETSPSGERRLVVTIPFNPYNLKLPRKVKWWLTASG